MNGRNYSKVLTVILVIIIIAIVGLLGYLGYDYFSRTIKTNSANDFVDSFEKQQTSSLDETPNTPSSNSSSVPNESTSNTQPNGSGIDDTYNELINSNTTTETNPNKSTQTKKKSTYNGFEVLGTIEIPKTSVKYPVLAKYSAKALDTAVCIAYPQNAELNSVGNVVIVGHNYRNGSFFSNNKKLSVGDKIYISDLSGRKVTYIIYNKYQTDENDTKSYKKNTNGKREITLSTCTDDAKARIIIEAREQ